MAPSPSWTRLPSHSWLASGLLLCWASKEVKWKMAGWVNGFIEQETSLEPSEHAARREGYAYSLSISHYTLLGPPCANNSKNISILIKMWHLQLGHCLLCVISLRIKIISLFLKLIIIHLSANNKILIWYTEMCQIKENIFTSSSPCLPNFYYPFPLFLFVLLLFQLPPLPGEMAYSLGCCR